MSYEQYDASKKFLEKARKHKTYTPNQLSFNPSFNEDKVQEQASETFTKDQVENPEFLIKNPRRRGAMDLSYVVLERPMNSILLLQEAQEQMALRRTMFDVKPTSAAPASLFGR